MARTAHLRAAQVRPAGDGREFRPVSASRLAASHLAVGRLPGVVAASVALACTAVLLLGLASAALAAGYAGWERGGAYESHYDPRQLTTVKGVVQEIVRVVPLEGMSPGLALVLLDRDGNDVLVHVGPEPYARSVLGAFREGSKIKVKGVPAVIDGQPVLMAAKLRMDEFREVKLRMTQDGWPAWDYKGLWQK